MSKQRELVKARRVRYHDGFAFERGLEDQGFGHDSEKTYRTKWHGIDVEIQLWSKPMRRGNAMQMLLLRVGDHYELYKQVGIGGFFDGDEDELEVLDR